MARVSNAYETRKAAECSSFTIKRQFACVRVAVLHGTVVVYI